MSWNPHAKATRRIENRPEQDLQISVAQFLDVALMPIPTAFYFAVPNGYKMNKVEAAIARVMGRKAGVCDLFAFYFDPISICATAFGIELKAPGEKCEPDRFSPRERAKRPGVMDQAEVHARLAAAAVVTTVQNSVEGVERFLIEHRVPLVASTRVLFR